MAVTKIHPIKSTLKKALDYIENPDKTEDKMLVSSFGCSYETADIEFEMLLAQAIQKGNNLAHHLIQSFAPGEATPEQAHEIGKQLADEVLQGKYSYVLTTHIDKGHVHNHLIFCAVDMVNHRKYNSNRQSYAYIRRTSDRLCREHGLSVVQPSRDKGKSYAEWDAGRKGKSWKAKLKAAIDAVIPQAKNFDDFLRLMAAQGYEIKQGKFISFRAPGQERFTRCKTLGENYTEEAITSRIKGLAVDRGPNRQRKGITLRIDLENNIKAQQSAGYARWAKLQNLKQAAKTMNFLTEHGIEQYAELGKQGYGRSARSTTRRLRPSKTWNGVLGTWRADKEPHHLQAVPARGAGIPQGLKTRLRSGANMKASSFCTKLRQRPSKDAGITRLPDLAALKAEYRELDKQKARLYEQYGEVSES